MNQIYDNLTHRIFKKSLDRLTKYRDRTAEKCYLSSNEYLSDYMADMDLKNKKVATVGSSGDQFFQSLLQGSRDITIIDANPYTKLFVEYKKAFFMNLDFETAINKITKMQIFDCATYAKISHDISPYSRIFWDKLMIAQEEYVPGENKFSMYTIAEKILHPELMFLCDFYSDKETYLKLQQILNEKEFSIKYLIADFNDFSKVLNNKFDLIMLSNIYRYHSKGEELIKFEKSLNELFSKNLNEGGVIQVQYSYRTHDSNLDPEKIAGHDLRIKRTGKPSNPRTVYFIDKPVETNSLSY